MAKPAGRRAYRRVGLGCPSAQSGGRHRHFGFRLHIRHGVFQKQSAAPGRVAGGGRRAFIAAERQPIGDHAGRGEYVDRDVHQSRHERSDEYHRPQFAAQHILIYVGARAIGGSTIADSEFGKASAVGTAASVNTVLNRGQAANTDLDRGEAKSASIQDQLELDPSTDIPANQFDFTGAALHEVLHILGYGNTPSWTRYVDASGFNGPITDAFHDEINKGAVPLSSDESHWAAGTEVTVGSGSVPLMIPISLPDVGTISPGSTSRGCATSAGTSGRGHRPVPAASRAAR